MHGPMYIKFINELETIADDEFLFISVFNQPDAQKFCFTISFISCLYMFRANVLETCRGMK